MANAKELLQKAAEPLQKEADKLKQQIDKERAAHREKVQPLEDALSELQDAIARITGKGGTASRGTTSGARRSRSRMSPEERENAILDYLKANPGANGTQVAEGVGVSTATISTTINQLIQQKKIKAEGERRARKLYAA